ncbi:MAG: glycosyltransferase [Propionicimonas sp.]
MRIISVVTLITPDGAYGGPVRVAVNQAAALSDLGHQVILLAGHRGFAEAPSSVDGFPVRLYPAHHMLPGTGFAGLISPGLLRALRGLLPGADVVHIHAARDLITLPAAALAAQAKVPYFLQTHGMIDPSDHPLAKPLDALLTRRLLRGAATVFHLTDFERRQLTDVAGPLHFRSLANGVPLAQPTRPSAKEVLYLARLAPRKRPLAFVEAAQSLHEEFPDTRFALVGPDEGEGPAVAEAIQAARALGSTIDWEGGLAPEETLDRMSSAAVYVLPSVNEPYPMSVLEAMSLGKPVVVTDTCGLAGFVTKHEAGLVVDSHIPSLVEAIRTLLGDPAKAQAMGRRGRNAVREELSMDAIGRSLVARYREALSS